jgi:hypothetical protein
VSVLVDPTDHNPNTPPPATPLVSGSTIRLPGHHAKVNRDGYIGCRRGGPAGKAPQLGTAAALALATTLLLTWGRCGSTARGPPMAAEHLRPPALHRLYRATVSQHWILCTSRELGSPCPLHGRAFDHRIRVAL